MPTYEYQCKKCGHVFDHFQSIKAKPLKSWRCDRCSRVRPVQRLIGTGAALLFRGSGFYQTDYRSDSYKKAASAESKPAGDGKKESATKSADAAAKKSDSSTSKSESGKKP